MIYKIDCFLMSQKYLEKPYLNPTFWKTLGILIEDIKADKNTSSVVLTNTLHKNGVISSDVLKVQKSYYEWIIDGFNVRYERNEFGEIIFVTEENTGVKHHVCKLKKYFERFNYPSILYVYNIPDTNVEYEFVDNSFILTLIRNNKMNCSYDAAYDFYRINTIGINGNEKIKKVSGYGFNFQDALEIKCHEYIDDPAEIAKYIQNFSNVLAKKKNFDDLMNSLKLPNEINDFIDLM